jgi:hypothetical protein
MRAATTRHARHRSVRQLRRARPPPRRHVMSPFKAGSLAFAVTSPLLRLVANVILPTAHAALPDAYVGLDPAPSPHEGGRWPVVIFSHGLTGTGEEHATLFSAWARAGFVVACVHHCDGSSSRARAPDDTEVYYHLPPGMNGRPGVYPPEYADPHFDQHHRLLTVNNHTDWRARTCARTHAHTHTHTHHRRHHHHHHHQVSHRTD